MVLLLNKEVDMDDTMPQTVPSAGFTPPCDYSNFADNFDLSLLPGGDLPLSPSTQLYNSPKPKVYTTFYPSSPEHQDLGPDFQKLLEKKSVYLEVPTNNNYHANSPSGALSPYSPQGLEPFQTFLSPCSPENSLYATQNGTEDFRIKTEEIYSAFEVKEELSYQGFSTQEIKKESTVDFSSLLETFGDEKPKDHQLLRQVLRDTSFQRRHNVRTFDIDFTEIKMEEPEEMAQEEIISRENIEPALSLAIEQMRKDVDSTCVTLGISRDPEQWSTSNVWSWIQWTTRQFGLPTPVAEQWELSGAALVELGEEDFVRRAPQGGMILHAQLEIWKAAYSEERMQWIPTETTASSNTSSGDVSDDDEESSSSSRPEASKPSTSRASSSSSSHIHLWQFLKELLASPQVHGSCIRWLDRSKGIFKIEDSVKVARLWGKRKNRPAMNYDKLSRSIRQYYKKGIMKKTERSQRLVYQFCHPYNL